ncbi:hypothetical protein Q2E61_09315 [Microbulbifer thermotolerans]|uniref:hypothetical protein n=1 Tax=Microbulbifer thermotolerans TaxID=252514 RepID=UPI002673F6A3|nr:hypothetical protein [Microbulbifer thermotolerans]WKT59126.1 hypothetical protein Q2E61_09315 [Microbulbifer thermotolerans]
MKRDWLRTLASNAAAVEFGLFLVVGAFLLVYLLAITGYAWVLVFAVATLAFALFVCGRPVLNRLLFWLSGRLPCRQINLPSGPYLERYYLGRLFGVTFYLHRFVSSDSERHLHNHPWEWGGSVILTGSYIEERAVDLCPTAGPAGCATEMVRRRWFNRVDGNTIHRIHDAEPGTWTLFFHGPRAEVCGHPKGWGFLRQIGDLDAGTVTMFVPYPHRHGNWWETARAGNEIGRVPL